MPKWTADTLRSVLRTTDRAAIQEWARCAGLSTESVERLQLRLVHLRTFEHPPMANRWDTEMLARLFDALKILEAEDA